MLQLRLIKMQPDIETLIVTVTDVARNFDWEGLKMENLVTLDWLRFSVTK